MFDSRYRFRGYPNNQEELLKSGAMRFLEDREPIEPREASKILLYLPVGIRLWLLKEVFTNYAGFYDEKGNLKEEEDAKEKAPAEKGEPLISTLDFQPNKHDISEFDNK